MIAKKNPRLNLEKHRATIFGIGLLAAGSFTLAAFTYTSPLQVEEDKLSSTHSDVIYTVQQEEPVEEPIDDLVEDPQEPEVSTTTVMTEVKEEIKKTQNSKKVVKSNVTSDDKKGLQDGPKDKIKITRKKVKKDPVKFPDREAEFVGGVKEMKLFILDTQRYPDEAIGVGAEGTALVTFVVEVDGTVTEVKARSVKGEILDRSLRREAERIVRNFPKWIPGEVAGRRVRCLVNLPITFRLQ